MADIGPFLDQAWEGKEFADLAAAPIDAIQGLSRGDAEALQKAFNIKTIQDLATNKHVLVAQAIVALSRVQQAAVEMASATDAAGDHVQAASNDARGSRPLPSEHEQTRAGQAEAAADAFAG